MSQVKLKKMMVTLKKQFDALPNGQTFISDQFLKLADDPSNGIEASVLDKHNGTIIVWHQAVVEHCYNQ